jgi:hypothetical protein
MNASAIMPPHAIVLSGPARPDSGLSHHGTSPRAAGLGWSQAVAGTFWTRYRGVPRVVRPDVVGSNRVRTKPQVLEAAMTSGLILLILIGILVAYVYTRLRGKMKLSVSGKNWIAPVVIVGIIALMLWASSGGH